MAVEGNVLDVDEEDFYLDFRRDIDRTFGVKLTDEEVGTFETVGDVFAVVRSRLNGIERSDALPCLTAATFYALRRALLVHNPGANTSPKSLLGDSITAKNPKKVWRDLEEHSQLSLPSLQPTKASEIVALMMVIISVLIGGFIALEHLSIDFERITAFLALGLLGNMALALFVSLMAGLVLACVTSALGPKEIPKEIKTVGDLAEATAKLNLSSYAKRFGAVRNRDVWASLVWIIQEFGWPKIPINADTRFFPKKLDPPDWLKSR